jgi:hypothetical protein
MDHFVAVQSGSRLGSKHKVLVIMFVILTALLLFAPAVRAMEGGGTDIPLGNEDSMMGAPPPPGLYYLNYIMYYQTNSLKDNSGKDVTAPNGAKVDFKADATANIFRLAYVSNITFLGANLIGHVVLPLVYSHASVAGESESKTGLGDIDVVAGLAWHFKDWHLTAIPLDITVPTGSYDKTDLVNIGRDYYSFEPKFVFSYLPKNGFELSSIFGYAFNTVNPDTHYVSGQETWIQPFIGYRWLDKHLTFGAVGYIYRQTTDDYSRRERVQNYRAQVDSIGPLIKYDYKNMSFIFKAYFETDAKNRPEGQQLWFRFNYCL